jgi:hypothetical protein
VFSKTQGRPAGAVKSLQLLILLDRLPTIRTIFPLFKKFKQSTHGKSLANDQRKHGGSIERYFLFGADGSKEAATARLYRALFNSVLMGKLSKINSKGNATVGILKFNKE